MVSKGNSGSKTCELPTTALIDKLLALAKPSLNLLSKGLQKWTSDSHLERSG